MIDGLSAVLITKNNADLIEPCFTSLKLLTHDIIIVDNGSTDRTTDISRSFGARIYTDHTNDLGVLRGKALQIAKGPWIVTLDADERLSPELEREIRHVLSTKNAKDGYLIPFRNHLFGHSISHGGENYKMLRLFKKEAVVIRPNLVHERYELKKEATQGNLSSPIDHYSYRSLPQMFGKFTNYAIRDARQKYRKGEKVSLKKVALYGPHMFYARFFKDQGYKDGVSRIVLDGGFAYMEALTYWTLAYYQVMHRKT